MAEAIVGPLVGRLQELALGQARALVGVNADIQKLKDKLMWLQAFLREADAKRRAVSDEVTKVWVLQTRDAVFDAEDALDHYYLHFMYMYSGTHCGFVPPQNLSRPLQHRHTFDISCLGK
ncbi:hypothetical protein EE612_039423 [Oryza sativa]|nr:hypothetical protein EE612_039423 [Oryza sativa]